MVTSSISEVFAEWIAGLEFADKGLSLSVRDHEMW